jgi:hypothetical protein
VHPFCMRLGPADAWRFRRDLHHQIEELARANDPSVLVTARKVLLIARDLVIGACGFRALKEMVIIGVTCFGHTV